MRNTVSPYFFLLLSILGFAQIDCSDQRSGNKTMSNEELLARGKYLANFGGCNDCHSPKIMTNMGPVPDTTKLLSGHPEGGQLPPIDTSITNSKGVFTTMDLTAWAGPWGISFPINLTPDGETGIGNWTEEVFFKAMREGKHLGAGRPILPPMPWQSLASLKDEDLRAIFLYLKSLKPVHNKVLDPIAPNMVAQTANKGK
ncbi:MAG: diheme cytochrome c-553 [Bacteroidota bacterium]|nr:diheme cytochrome c-553 [Bacteroidota bacterium]